MGKELPSRAIMARRQTEIFASPLVDAPTGSPPVRIEVRNEPIVLVEQFVGGLELH
jgi:hypothetical protein